MTDPQAREVPGDAVPRLDAGIAFVIAALYAAVWEVTFALYGVARSSNGTPLLAIMGLLLGAPAGAAFAALVAIRPSPRLAPSLAARLGVLAAIPCAAFLMAWSLGSAFAFGGWRDIGTTRPQLAVISLLLGAACALLTAPLLRLLTMPTAPD